MTHGEAIRGPRDVLGDIVLRHGAAGPDPHKAVGLGHGQRGHSDALAESGGGHLGAVAAAVVLPAVVRALNAPIHHRPLRATTAPFNAQTSSFECHLALLFCACFEHCYFSLHAPEFHN